MVKGSKYLIVNGDDFGLTKGINRGIVDCYQHGILRSTTIMCNMPYANEAIYAAQQCPGLGFGVHVTLNAGKPLLPPGKVRTLIDDKGYFIRDFAVFIKKADRAQIVAEIRAQIGYALCMGIPITHIDSHYNYHGQPELLEAFILLAKEYKLPIRSLAADIPNESPKGILVNKCFDGFHKTNVTTQYFIDIVSNLKEGVTEIMTHPGYTDEELIKVSSYSRWREFEQKVLTNSMIAEHITAQSIVLANYSILASTN